MITVILMSIVMLRFQLEEFQVKKKKSQVN